MRSEIIILLTKYCNVYFTVNILNRTFETLKLVFKALILFKELCFEICTFHLLRIAPQITMKHIQLETFFST